MTTPHSPTEKVKELVDNFHQTLNMYSMSCNGIDDDNSMLKELIGETRFLLNNIQLLLVEEHTQRRKG